MAAAATTSAAPPSRNIYCMRGCAAQLWAAAAAAAGCRLDTVSQVKPPGISADTILAPTTKEQQPAIRELRQAGAHALTGCSVVRHNTTTATSSRSSSRHCHIQLHPAQAL